MHWMALLLIHTLKLYTLTSGKIVSPVTYFPNNSIFYSRIFNITLIPVTPNLNGKIFKDEAPGSPELGQAWFLCFTEAAIQSHVLTATPVVYCGV